MSTDAERDSGRGEATFVTEGAVLVGDDPRLWWISPLPLFGALGYVAAGIAFEPAWLPLPFPGREPVAPVQFFAALFYAFPFSLLLALGAGFRKRRELLRLHAGRSGLTIGGRFFPRSALGDAVVQPGSPAGVVLRRRGFSFWPDVEVEVRGPDEAAALLIALGLDPSICPPAPPGPASR